MFAATRCEARRDRRTAARTHRSRSPPQRLTRLLIDTSLTCFVLRSWCLVGAWCLKGAWCVAAYQCSEGNPLRFRTRHVEQGTYQEPSTKNQAQLEFVASAVTVSLIWTPTRSSASEASARTQDKWSLFRPGSLRTAAQTFSTTPLVSSPADSAERTRADGRRLRRRPRKPNADPARHWRFAPTAKCG